jgi:hypothetical protein
VRGRLSVRDEEEEEEEEERAFVVDLLSSALDDANIANNRAPRAPKE